MDVGQVIQIGLLPDDVLLEIFDFYVDMSSGYDGNHRFMCVDDGGTLFSDHRVASICNSLYTRNARKRHIGCLASLASYHSEHSGLIKLSLSNIITALGQSNRVRQVALYLAGWQLEEVFAAMQVPFPELIHLQLRSYDKTLPVIPDSFLGESAPRL